MTKPETYMKVADRYGQRLTELAKINPNSNFSDIARNVFMGVSGYAQLINLSGEVTSDDRKRFLRTLRRIKTYYNLIDKHPEFRQGEFTPRGAFPDLLEFAKTEEGIRQAREVGIEGAQSHYVYLAKQKLERKLATS